MNDDEFLRNLRRHNESSRSLFSNKNKGEREKMTCRAFLRCINREFTEKEILKGPREPVDIAFCGAAFQIAEIIELGRQRSQELKEQKQRYREAKAKDLIEPWRTPCPISMACVTKLISSQFEKKSIKLGGREGCRGTDALAYVNLRDRYLVVEDGIADAHEIVNQFRAQGWRSASFVMIPYGMCLFADDSAPEFLTKIEGRILINNTRTDGWFDA